MPVIPPPPREFDTYDPTGDASWPLTGLAGVDHAGKTYLAAQASGSDLIGQTFFIPFGEAEANAYGRVPGARFRIVHLPDGSYRTLLGAVLWAVRQPRVTPEKPNLIILDGGTKLYHMLQEEQQIAAYQRAVVKARKNGWREPDPDSLRISNDLWTVIKERWAAVIDPLKEHDGPAIVTVLLEDLMVVNDKGEPTKDRTWKWQAHKTLQSRCDDTLEIRDRDTRDVLITGTRSLIWRPADGEGDGRRIPGFTFDRYWRALGLDKAPVSQPAVPKPDPGAYVAEVAEQTARDVAANEHAEPIKAEEVHAILKQAQTEDDPWAYLVQHGNRLGEDRLAQLTIEVPDPTRNGERVTMDGAAVFHRWIGYYQHLAEQQAASREARAAQAAAEAPQVAPEPAPQAAPKASAAPTGGKPQGWPVERALRAEIALQAKILGQQDPNKYAGWVLSQLGVASFEEIAAAHVAVVAPWVVGQRDRVIQALAAAGNAVGAASYRGIRANGPLPQDLFVKLWAGDVPDAAPAVQPATA